MLYPLSYWSFTIAAPSSDTIRGSEIITAETARLNLCSR